MQRIEELLRRLGLGSRPSGENRGTPRPVRPGAEPADGGARGADAPAGSARSGDPGQRAGHEPPPPPLPDTGSADLHGLVLLEIDDFPSYEALFGEQAARGILHAVEERVMPALAAQAGFWSPGRGKLAVSLPGADLEGIRMTARHLQRLVARDGLDTPAGRLFVTVSAGCAVADTAALPLLGPTAERALGDARRAGRGRCRIVPATAGDAAGPDIGEAALRDLEAGRVTFAFQAVRRIDGSGRAAAFLECLARLPNAGSAPVEAARFMPSLIEAGQAPALDRLALERALELMAVNPAARLSVNVSRQTMEDPGWLGLLTARCAVDLSLGDRLIVELSERDLVAEPALAGGFMAAVRRSGAALALDRYGQSPLTAAELRSFHVDIVKLAPELCHGIVDEPVRQIRLRERITLARAADLMIVATGVERQADAEWLSRAGASHAQGRLIAPPDAAPDELSTSHVTERAPTRFGLYG